MDQEFKDQEFKDQGEFKDQEEFNDLYRYIVDYVFDGLVTFFVAILVLVAIIYLSLGVVSGGLGLLLSLIWLLTGQGG